MPPKKKPRLTKEEAIRLLKGAPKEDKSSSQKIKLQVKKVESPLAKYNNLGQLTCIVCNCVVKSESVWIAHVNGRSHRDNVKIFKSSADQTLENNQKLKRKLLKDIDHDHVISIAAKPTLNESEEKRKRFREGTVISSGKLGPEDDSEGNQTSQVKDTSLPEGFFDDPHLDAKARHVEYKDPVEEEWDKFQKSIKEESTVSAAIVEEEQTNSTAERHLEEIEEQMRHWSRVIQMEKMKDSLKKIKNFETSVTQDIMEVDSTDDEEDIEDLLDWRSKAT